MHEHLKSVCAFIADYATALVGCGATTKRITLNVDRIAHTYNTQVDMTILSGHVMLTVRDLDARHTYTLTRRIPDTPIDFTLNSLLSRLSWKIADCGLAVDTARAMFEALLRRKRLNIVLVTMLTGLANASFCHLFGGDWQAMAVVFFATIDGFWIKHLLTSRWKCNIFAATFISASVAALIACSALVFGWGTTPQTALATSVLFLVPGVPFINGLSDMMTGNYVCCVGRLFRAVMLTVCLTGGLMVAMFCMNIDTL